MSGSLTTLALLCGSFLAQPGETADLEKLRGTWVGTTFPVAVEVDGSKGSIHLPGLNASTSPAIALDPIQFAITSVTVGLPNSTLEFSATFPKSIGEHPWTNPPGRFLVVHRVFDDEISLALLPIPTGVSETVDPQKIDLAGDAPTSHGMPLIRLKRVPPEQAAGFAELRGEWTWLVPPAKPGGLLVLDFEGTILTIRPGFASVWLKDRSTGRRSLYKSARVILDPKAKRAILQPYPLGEHASETVTFDYAMEGENRFTAKIVGHEGEAPLSFARSRPEELVEIDLAEKALASLQGSWTLRRLWRRRDGRDSLDAAKSEETWTVADRRLTIDAGGKTTHFTIEQTGDLHVIRIVDADDPAVVRQIGRFETADGTLRIRLHPSIVPEEAPAPVEKNASRVRTQLYEFEKAKAP